MLKNENIICISSIDWDFNWQGHQEIMAAFAKQGNRVLYIENMGVRVPNWKDLPRLRRRIGNWRKGIRGIRKVEENLYVFSPIVLPFPYSRVAGLINRRILLSELKQWMRAMSFESPIIWTFLPTGTAVDLIEQLDKKLVVYYCVADFETLVTNPRKVRRTQERLLRQCDVVFAQGEELKRACERYHRPVHVFPCGVDSEKFLHAERTAGVPQDLAPLRRPIVGYCGGLHRHVDYGLVRGLALRHPDWSLVFVGPVQTDVSALRTLENVFLLGEKSHTDLPFYIKNFDVCLVPYLLSDYTSTVYPSKMNEYLILGKPVVSTDLPEIRNFNSQFRDSIRVGRNPEEFEKCVLHSIAEKNGEKGSLRKEAALEQSWKKRIMGMSEILQAEIDRKSSVRERMWREDFLKFLKGSSENLLRWTFFTLASIALLFYTPLVWVAARPLKLSDAPQKADAIVVVGAGVGETGEPGTSTLERTRYAVELYREGWAPEIIFSSGYVYSYQEAQDMRLIATSSGVPKENILLETDSSSTYENVLFIKRILDRKKWNSILLIGAPYHMRRISLVFRKVAPQLKVYYLPIQKSSFYDASRNPVQLDQIRALSHEALGIIYYWFKGYV